MSVISCILLQVISGQHLPKPPQGSKTGEVIDPYVVIQVVGVPEDRHIFKTKPVNDNGIMLSHPNTFTYHTLTPSNFYSLTPLHPHIFHPPTLTLSCTQQ